MRITSEVPIPISRRLLTAEQMRALDRKATEQYGIPSLLLMENAGRAVARVAIDLLGGDARGRGVLVVCGQGNNGGDGFVAARHLSNAGAKVIIAYYGDRSKAKGDALTNIEIAEKMHQRIEQSPDLGDPPGFDAGIGMDLIIDALLGTGVKGEVREPLSRVIEQMDSFAERGDSGPPGVPVVAVDVPSGIDADTGAILGPPLRASRTVTFGLAKVGLVTYPAANCVGDLHIADISLPYESLAQSPYAAQLPDLVWTSVVLGSQRKDRDAHKGTFGHCAIVAGSVGMTGAATLAAQGALRIGTGLVTLLVPESLNDIMEAKVTEAMTIPVPQGKARAFGTASLPKVLEYVEKWDSAVIGPGFGRDGDTVAFTLELLRSITKPAIVDADALFAVSTDIGVLKQCKAPIVITPHPGEMATLLGTTAAEVQSNRLETARSFAAEHGVTVVLKGAGTVIAEPDGTAWINTTGTPGMATGGTGDVLSGMIGGLLAQGMSPSQAACAAVYLHGRAGEIAAEKLGEAAMIAGDVADNIGAAIKEVVSE